jgi:hypothetical protein
MRAVGSRGGTADATDLKSVGAKTQVTEIAQVTSNAKPTLSPSLLLTLQDDSELRGLVLAWPTIPDAVKTGLLAMARGAVAGDGERV